MRSERQRLRAYKVCTQAGERSGGVQCSQVASWRLVWLKPWRQSAALLSDSALVMERKRELQRASQSRTRVGERLAAAQCKRVSRGVPGDPQAFPSAPCSSLPCNAQLRAAPSSPVCDRVHGKTPCRSAMQRDEAGRVRAARQIVMTGRRHPRLARCNAVTSARLRTQHSCKHAAARPDKAQCKRVRGSDFRRTEAGERGRTSGHAQRLLLRQLCQRILD